MINFSVNYILNLALKIKQIQNIKHLYVIKMRIDFFNHIHS